MKTGYPWVCMCSHYNQTMTICHDQMYFLVSKRGLHALCKFFICHFTWALFFATLLAHKRGVVARCAMLGYLQRHVFSTT